VTDTGLLLDGRYRIVTRRASGATATVWETEDEFLRRRVAVKILHEHLAADPDVRARFIEEARTAATVNHPNLVAVYDSIVDQPGIVLEWVDGPDLRQRLDEGILAAEEAVEIGVAVCAGLAALHARGLVHRDIKPANILLTRSGQPKLTDFGIATANAGDRTATGVVLGTAKYLAPEQVRGRDLDGRADLFALAAVLYEALAGNPPWERDGDLATALARLEEEPTDLRDLRPDLPATLRTAVMRGLAREPAARWSDVADFATALQGGSTLSPPPEPPLRPQGPGRPTVAMTVPPAATPRVRSRRRRWPRVVGFIVVAAIAALGWTLVSSVDGNDPPPITGDDVVSIRSATAFDPEGTGAPGEHDERAPLAIDLDPATAWPTERYATRDLGAKSGVGLVLALDRVADIERVTIRTEGATDWATEIRVATGMSAEQASAITDFGPARGGGSGLGPVADLTLGARGDAVVVWITDLGAGDTPIRLAISEITIR
jgi:serine/threonine-protein kinase